MTACFIRPTPQTLWEQLTSWFSANVLGGAPIIPESNEHYLCGNDLAAMELYYSLSQQQWNETQDETACCESLIKNNARLGLIPKAATFAQGYVSVAAGPPNDPIPSTLQIQIGSNPCFLSAFTNANPTHLDVNGDAILLFQAQNAGSTSNTSINEAIAQIGTSDGITATLMNSPVGWPTTVTPNGNFCGGNDAEQCEAFRSRVIARKKFQPSTTISNLFQKVLEFPCVTRVMQRTCGDCCNNGVVELYAFMDEAFPNGIVPVAALQGLTDYIFGSPQGEGRGQVPIGIYGNFYQVVTVPLNINFFNMGCITPSQFQTIKLLISQLFDTLTPGQRVCSKWIDAIVVSVNPNCCNYVIQVSAGTAGLGTVDCFGDYAPICDVLPTLGTVNYSAQLASQ